MSASVSTAEPGSPRAVQQLLDLLAEVPASREPPHPNPRARSIAITQAARRKAFLASSSLALPPGPLGWLTVLPELVAIWRIQARMVADIAAACGLHTTLTREQMVYCLFRHAASQAVRDLAVRAGQRWMVQATTTQLVRELVRRIGAHVSGRMLGSSLARLLPVAGAIGVGAYAWYDTREVGRTAIAMFTQDNAFAGVVTDVAGRDRAQAAREAGL